MWENLKCSSVDRRDRLCPVGGGWRQIICEKIARYFPWTTNYTSRLPGQIRVEEVMYTLSPARFGIIHLHCPQPRIPAKNKRFPGGPNQAAPEQVIYSQHE